jgi:hypothetical protein
MSCGVLRFGCVLSSEKHEKLNGICVGDACLCPASAPLATVSSPRVMCDPIGFYHATNTRLRNARVEECRGGAAKGRRLGTLATHTTHAQNSLASVSVLCLCPLSRWTVVVLLAVVLLCSCRPFLHEMI